jgi:hypothetical protein
MAHPPVRSVLLPAAVACAVACAPTAIPAPTSCHEDAECPADARCVASTCTGDIAPRAIITGPRSAAAGAEVVFDGSASTDDDDAVASYIWSVRMLASGCAPELGESGQPTFRMVLQCEGEVEVMLVVGDRLGVVSEPAIAPVTIAAQ